MGPKAVELDRAPRAAPVARGPAVQDATHVDSRRREDKQREAVRALLLSTTNTHIRTQPQPAPVAAACELLHCSDQCCVTRAGQVSNIYARQTACTRDADDV